MAQANIRIETDPCPLGGDYWPESVDFRDLSVSGEMPVWGMADTHAHFMTHLAFGGSTFWGRPDGPIEIALSPCKPLHGPFGLSRAGLLDLPHFNGGYPDFCGWPHFTTLNHQQMYVDWIKRAYQGGLRLVVSFAINNELLARLTGATKCDDASSVREQIVATCDFVKRNSHFIEIAYTPSEARAIIRSNKLAVILGMEVDTLGLATTTSIATECWLNEIYDELGIRHIFPIHLADNQVGGAAIYNDLFDFVNSYTNGKPFEAMSAPDGDVQFRLGETGCILKLLRILARMPKPRKSRAGHMNSLGLTEFGRNVLLPLLMRRGMVIDIDHMSARSVNDALEIAERFGYPLVAGHASFQELAWDRGETGDSSKLTNEYRRTPGQVQKIRELGGMISVGLNQGDIREFRGGIVQNNCAGSSKSFAQAYLYAVSRMGEAQVAFGSDMNGLARAPGPRFGPNAAYYLRSDSKRRQLRAEQREEQTDAIYYDKLHSASIPPRLHAPIVPSSAGHRTFDLNTDGFCHYGMLPDFLQDLRNVGLTPAHLSPLFCSAESYIRVWERCHADRNVSPVTRVAVPKTQDV